MTGTTELGGPTTSGQAVPGRRGQKTQPQPAPDQTRSDEAATILRTLATLTEPLAAIIPGDCEVALHDLSLLPNSIVAIAGALTGRNVGSPATDMLLRASARGVYETAIGYPSRHPDGRELRSSTLIVRDSAGAAVAALCINADTRAWRLIHTLAASMLPDQSFATTTTSSGAGLGREASTGPGSSEEFPSDVDDLAENLLAGALDDANVPVDLMHKRHKLSVVSDLKDRGFFLLKGAAETAASALGVTRFTIYNYLREIEQNSAEEEASSETPGEATTQGLLGRRPGTAGD